MLLTISNWDGMYVLYTYAAKRQTARNVQLLLSNPEAGSEDKILRHITLCRCDDTLPLSYNSGNMTG